MGERPVHQMCCPIFANLCGGRLAILFYRSPLSSHLVWRQLKNVKFIYSEKATKFCEIFLLLLTTVHTVKSKWKISQNFVAFSEYMNFNTRRACSIIEYCFCDWTQILHSIQIVHIKPSCAVCPRHLSNMVNMVFDGCVRRVDSLSK